MTTSNHNSRWLLLALPLLGAFAGCWCQAFPLPAEGRCPTDARRIYCGAGEEAVRRCPCGPDRDFYGHKPTDWRPWPAGWRCGQYPYYPPGVDGTIAEERSVDPTALPEVANPFRNDGNVIVAPPSVFMNAVEPSEINFGVPPTAPAKTLPSQPESIKSPPLEVPPVQAPPANEKQDWRSAADVINNVPVVPPASAEPPTPEDELNPPIPPGVTPEKNDATKGSSNIDLLPKLISAQNAAATGSAAAITGGPPVSASKDKAPAKLVRGESDRSPVTRRVADHLTHTLFK